MWTEIDKKFSVVVAFVLSKYENEINSIIVNNRKICCKRKTLNVKKKKTQC